MQGGVVNGGERRLALILRIQIDSGLYVSRPSDYDGGLSFNVQMTPKKALRAAMLKKCFADMIFKATHWEYSDHSEKSDRLRLQQERERREQEHQEEGKAKIEEQFKAVEEAPAGSSII